MNMHSLLLLAVLDLVIMIGCYGIERRTRRAGIVDAGWCLAIMLASITCACLHTAGDLLTRLFIAIACGLWFARLGGHLLLRYSRETHEDGRYARMRAACGSWDGLGFLIFFVFQAGLALVFSLPMWVLTQIPSSQFSPWHPLLIGAAAILMLSAWIGESIADHQLAHFRRQPDNRGKTLRHGLWAYSRHPNYFFEWLHWIAYPLIGLDAGVYVLWIYPLLMFLFLYYITGIPFTEQQALLSRGDDYRRYQHDTSIFFPRSPRR